MKWIELLREIPMLVPGLLVTLAVLCLMVAIGADMVVGMDTKNINRFWAGIIGAGLLVIGVLIFFLPRIELGSKLKTPEKLAEHPDSAQVNALKDPFLASYVVGSSMVVVLFWGILRLTSAQLQVMAVDFEFGLVAVLIVVAVVRRYLDLKTFVQSKSNEALRPPGLTPLHFRVVPYVVTVGLAIILIVLATFLLASSEENRIVILIHFGALIIWLLLCRIVWEVLDYRALRQIGEL